MLTYDMQDRGGASLYEHLYRCIRADIERGVIAPREQLPSKRALAKHIGVSVITVEGAYAQLVAEGYVRAVERVGYFANEVSPVRMEVAERGRESLRMGAPAEAERGRFLGGSPAEAARGSSFGRVATGAGYENLLRETPTEAARGRARKKPNVSRETFGGQAAEKERMFHVKHSAFEDATCFRDIGCSESAICSGSVDRTEGAACSGSANRTEGTACHGGVGRSEDATCRGGVDCSRATARAESAACPEKENHSGEADHSEEADRSEEAGCFADAAAEAEPAVDFTGAHAACGLFPYKMWARTVRGALSAEDEGTLLEASGATGSEALRRALADYLRGFRGMDVSPDQVVVGAGAQTLYALIVQLLGRDLTYAIENPGYPRLAHIYRSNDVKLACVPLDDEGVRIDALRASGADVLHCMPSHQFPTGLVTPISRRREILGWAAEASERYVIEDDYDCEFRMAGRPIPSLQSIDEHERVIYANTFTKSLGAAFRIGYMVLPPHLARCFRERLGFYSSTVGTIDQLALARFIESGEYERHVSRLRTHYRRVQDALVARLRASAAADRIRLRNVGAGLHFVMEVEGCEEEELRACLRNEGVLLAPLSAYQFGYASQNSTKMFGYASQNSAKMFGCISKSSTKAVGAGFDSSDAHALSDDASAPAAAPGVSRAAFVMNLTGVDETGAAYAAEAIVKVLQSL
ncbi:MULTISPECIES: PLP-dependent aminotransferase family protein [unclassified Adlercreutzia]|uniref:MocR-like pyridoxine biosynthesis transcription factor PdxR n=1 Tax=unclassified Adlercreutzia TaxID=2636013 RepID=UPI0013ECC6C8|nr:MULTISPECIES: aminotransferase class I/II-fold pyridoxal phosphate-dependent enzyme [unclassified Adlercreutzia]